MTQQGKGVRILDNEQANTLLIMLKKFLAQHQDEVIVLGQIRDNLAELRKIINAKS